VKNTPPQTIYLADYQPFTHVIKSVHLIFKLDPTATRVTSRIEFAQNPRSQGGNLQLHGENLKLITAKINGKKANPQITDTGLSIPAAALPDGQFTWECEVEINPRDNTALEGLYMSKGMYCTQCEAEGFRKITYFPDRPDVMATYTVRIEGDDPVLLSNGNPTSTGDGWAEWHDPWPKPAYLFALVAGDLVAYPGDFTTASGQKVGLRIWVRAGDEDKCEYAMDALKRSMKWDEDVYGREYDLEVFNIVAVDDFNMGAMENKGLNVFNSKYVLASQQTATDQDYKFIEGIIAHEYFHNWTGNRITCRDWFQLCLKEGLTVFRDQQFSGDMRSHAVKRIEDVLGLRGRQFREDNGPLSHPVRPDRFVEINNFYTATVYQKGAEVIGMLKTLVGDDNYAKALDLYFDRHDGDAATIEDWISVFQDATGRNLSQFSRWYSQSGTPRLSVSDDFKDGVYTLHFQQETAPTPGQSSKQPQVLPIAVGLLNPNGDEVLPTTVLEMTENRQSFTFEGLASKPIPSILRGFSAPVILNRSSSALERAFLLAHDTDPFNKWEAGRVLAKDVLIRMITDNKPVSGAFLDALDQVARDETLDPAFRALALGLPGQDDVAQSLFESGLTPDPVSIDSVSELMMDAVAKRLSPALGVLYKTMEVTPPYKPDAKDAGRRALRHRALGYLSRLDGGEKATKQFAIADNMTEQLGALSCLLDLGKGETELASFYEQWAHDPNVIDKWFMLQVSQSSPDQTAAVAHHLCEHPDFDWKNPNRFRSVFGPLAMHPAGFHNPTGAGYTLLADWLIRLDPVNPQTTARMCVAFETWRRYDADRQELIRAQLMRIAETPNLSGDTTEMVGRILKG